MSYTRKNWTSGEIEQALANEIKVPMGSQDSSHTVSQSVGMHHGSLDTHPLFKKGVQASTKVDPSQMPDVKQSAAPYAHANKHAVAGELQQNKMFQSARVTTPVFGSEPMMKKGKPVIGSNGQLRRKVTLEKDAKPEVTDHSVKDRSFLANILSWVLNSNVLDSELKKLDAGTDLKAHVKLNYSMPMVDAEMMHLQQTVSTVGGVKTFTATEQTRFLNQLFIYLKQNPNNKDIPIFHTVVPCDSNFAKAAQFEVDIGL